jgi:hypothetical protein
MAAIFRLELQNNVVRQTNEQIYIYIDVQSYTTLYISRFGDKFRCIISNHQAFYFKHVSNLNAVINCIERFLKKKA